VTKQKKKNLYVEVFADYWDDFKQRYPAYSSEYYDKVVSKMINCGDPSFGYIEYGCMHCGKGKHCVAFTCKCSLCLRCSRVKSENFVYKVMNKLHPGVVYRHLILTIPDQLKKFFYQNRFNSDLYNAFYKAGWDYIQDVFKTVTKSKLKCGAIIVLHTAGRKGNYRPHLHIIVMNGGVNQISGEWVNVGYFPYEKILPRKWQWHLLNMVKGFDHSPPTRQIVDNLWKKYKNGFYNCFKKGDVPGRSQHLVKYLSKYLFRPQISLKRIKKYNRKRKIVIYEYADHKSHQAETVEVDVLEFIGRMVQQIPPKGFHRVKYYGLHHSKTYNKSKNLIIEGMKKINISVIDSAQSVFKVAGDSYQERMKLWTGRDPLRCPHCDHQMEVIKVWSKEKGVIFDLLEIYSKQSQAPPIELEMLQKMRATEPKDIVDDFYEQLDLAI